MTATLEQEVKPAGPLEMRLSELPHDECRELYKLFQENDGKIRDEATIPDHLLRWLPVLKERGLADKTFIGWWILMDRTGCTMPAKPDEPEQPAEPQETPPVAEPTELPADSTDAVWNVKSVEKETPMRGMPPPYYEVVRTTVNLQREDRNATQKLDDKKRELRRRTENRFPKAVESFKQSAEFKEYLEAKSKVTTLEIEAGREMSGIAEEDKAALHRFRQLSDPLRPSIAAAKQKAKAALEERIAAECRSTRGALGAKRMGLLAKLAELAGPIVEEILVLDFVLEQLTVDESALLVAKFSQLE